MPIGAKRVGRAGGFRVGGTPLVVSVPPPLPLTLEAQLDVVIVLVSRVTAAVRASSLPWIVAAVLAVMRRRGHDRADEARARPQRRRGADLPEDVARLRAVDERDAGVRARDQRGADLEDEHRVGVALGVERDAAR